MNLKLVSSKIDHLFPLIAPYRPWLRPAGRSFMKNIMRKLSKEELEKYHELIENFVIAIHDEIDDDVEILMKTVALLTSSVVSAGIISGDQMMSYLISYMIDNDLIHPQEISEKEMIAMQQGSKTRIH